MPLFDFKTVVLLAIVMCSLFALAAVTLGPGFGSRQLARRFLVANCAMAACLTFRYCSPAILPNPGYALMWTLWTVASVVLVSTLRLASEQAPNDRFLAAIVIAAALCLSGTATIANSPQLVAIVAALCVATVTGVLTATSWNIRQPALARMRIWLCGTFGLAAVFTLAHLPLRINEYLRGDTVMGHQAATYVAMMVLWLAANVGLMVLVQMRLVEKVAGLALRDELTGALNRRGMRQRLADQAGTAVVGGAVVIVDIDHFKHVNDAWGHTMGDRVLRWFSFQLQTFARESDFLVRLGGEEFAIVLMNCTPADASARAEKMCAWFARQVVFDRDGEELRVTASFGVAAFSGDETEFAESLKRADEALYAAKNGGRATVRRWSPEQAPAVDPFEHGQAPATLVV